MDKFDHDDPPRATRVAESLVPKDVGKHTYQMRDRISSQALNV